MSLCRERPRRRPPEKKRRRRSLPICSRQQNPTTYYFSILSSQSTTSQRNTRLQSTTIMAVKYRSPCNRLVVMSLERHESDCRKFWNRPCIGVVSCLSRVEYRV